MNVAEFTDFVPEVETRQQSDMGIKQLHLGRIRTAFDPKVDTILFPYTYMQLLGKDNSPINIADIDLIRLFEKPEERESVYKNCEALAHQYVNKFMADFERKHAVSYPRIAYCLSLLPYYFTMVTFAYARYLYIKKFLLVNQLQTFDVYTFSEQLPRNFETKDELFLNLLTNLDFQDWFASIIIERLDNKNILIYRTLGKVSIIEKKEKKQNFSKGFLALLKNKETWLKPHRLVIFLLERGLSGIPYVFNSFQNIYGVGPFQSLIYSIVLNVKALFNKKEKTMTLQGKGESKLDTSESLEFEEDFLEILETLIQHTMPVTYKEEYLGNIQKAQNDNHYIRGRIRFDSTGFSDDAKSFRHAAAVIAGERLAFCQHGSNYCTTQNAWASDGYEYLGDYFVNWGHNTPKQKSCTFLSLPSPAISKISNKHIEKNKHVILVGTNQRQTNDGIAIADASYAIDYLKSKQVFIDTLDENVKEQLYYRPWPTQDTDYFSDEAYIKRLYPDIKISTGSLVKNLLACRLVVLDHYGTAFYEAMASNTPVIIYFGMLELAFTPEAKKMFKRLQAVGIFHDSAYGAAKTISASFENIQEWWLSEKVQEIREEFCRLFALTDTKWSRRWIKQLSDLQ